MIGARLEDALRLDYPRERLEIVVADDGSSDGTREIVERFADEGVRLLDLPRRGKVAAQNAGAAATTAEVVAFSDANSLWEPGALRQLVRNLADPEVGYVCGQLRLADAADGDSREGLYWRYELWLREKESECGSITAGNGAIYAVRRSGFLELAGGTQPRPRAAVSPPPPGGPVGLRAGRDRARARPGDHRRRAAPQGAHALQAWWEILHGGMLDPRGQPPLYFVALLSHRGIRYASGPLHLVALAIGLALAPRDRAARRLVAPSSASGRSLSSAGASPSFPSPAPPGTTPPSPPPPPKGSCARSGGRSRTWAPVRGDS